MRCIIPCRCFVLMLLVAALILQFCVFYVTLESTTTVEAPYVLSPIVWEINHNTRHPKAAHRVSHLDSDSKILFRVCPSDEDFNGLVQQRRTAWKTNDKYRDQNDIWQNSVNDKLGGHLFARRMGVRVPDIYFCTGDGPDELQKFSPPKGGFVVKDLHGFSSMGVYVLEAGFGSKNRLNNKQTSLRRVTKSLRRMNARNIYVEEMINGAGGTVPTDYKFFMFNGVVSIVFIAQNKGTNQACTALYDEGWNRVDQFGCFVYDENESNVLAQGCSKRRIKNDTSRICSDIEQPKSYPRMLDIAKRLSMRIGVFMRIDLMESSNWEVVLGEFTPWPMAGKYHCAAKLSDGCVDPCFLGRTWKQASIDAAQIQAAERQWNDPNEGLEQNATSIFEGGPITPVPEYLKGWEELSTSEKCARIMDLDEDD